MHALSSTTQKLNASIIHLEKHRLGLEI